VNTHFAVDMVDGRPARTGRAVREFPDHPRIEGIAADGSGRFFYVSDEDEIVHLRCTPLLAGEDPQGDASQAPLRAQTGWRVGGGR
jgi:hypothetical protein